MHYVILRDDDTNALTPVECLERLYRPFLERGLPVNLAVIPKVRTNVTRCDGKPEGFLLLDLKNAPSKSLAIGSNERLVRYLKENPGYHVVQHGYHHSRNEFDSPHGAMLGERLERGTQLLLEAGFEKPETFVAPYDKLSRASYREVARRFRVISTGWFELRRLPFSWWPAYLRRKLRRVPHWQAGSTLLLSHPGCLLSYLRPYDRMLETVQAAVQRQKLTVLVTHWWEYFRDGQTDDRFIEILHRVAALLDNRSETQVISFAELVDGEIPFPD